MVQRKFSTTTLIYKHLYPLGPHDHEPRSWTQHVRDNLTPEAKTETAMYYGQDRTYEVKLPGLDYNYPPHRRRLARFPCHAALFAAFDALGLTRHEIYELCNWECTLFHKNKYIREHPSLNCFNIRDTTGEDIPTWEQLRGQQLYLHDEGVSDGASEAEDEYAEQEDDDDEGAETTDKEDVEMEEHALRGGAGAGVATEVAVERRGPRVATRPVPVTSGQRAMSRHVSLSTASVRA